MAEPSEKRDEIDEILTDAYGEYEQMSAWENTFLEQVETPFRANLLGSPVQVLGFQVGASDTLQCKVQAKGKERWIGVEDLDEEGLPEDFAHYYDLYVSWLEGGY